MYTTGGGGGGEEDFFWRVLKFFKGKVGVEKISEGRKRGCQFLDAIERLICPLFSSSVKDAFIIIAINCNVLLLCSVYMLLPHLLLSCFY